MLSYRLPLSTKKNEKKIKMSIQKRSLTGMAVSPCEFDFFSDNFRPTDLDFDVRFGWLFSLSRSLSPHSVSHSMYRPNISVKNVKYRLCLHDQDRKETITNLVCFRTNIFFLLLLLLNVCFSSIGPFLMFVYLYILGFKRPFTTTKTIL